MEEKKEMSANEMWKRDDLHPPLPNTEPAADEYVPEPGMDSLVVKIEKTTGAHLFDSDPELALIDREHGVEAFYRSVERAVIAKRNRVDFGADVPARDAWNKVTHKDR